MKKETFEENLQNSIDGFAYLLKDVAINIVEGKEWENGLTFDWSSAEKILYREQKRNLSND